MDQAQLSAIMKSFGAADTPENSNRIREFYAADPTAADRRQFGARGQSDESGGSRDAILNSVLDKVMALTDKTVPQSIESTTVPVMDTVKNSSVPTRKSATAAPTAAPTWANASENPNLGPVPARNASPGEGGAAKGDGLFDWLIPLLIGGAATGSAFRSPPANANANARGSGAGGMNSANRAVTGPNQNSLRLTAHPRTAAPAPYGTDLEIPKGGDVKGSPAVPVMPQSPQDVERLRAEVEAENASANALKEQMMQQTARQKQTSELAKAARRATGRK